MKKIILGVIAAMAVGATPALSADLPVRPPITKAPIMPPPVFSWTGCFIGGNGGGLWATKDWAVAPGDPSGFAVGAAFGSHDVNSWVAGGQIGCDYQFAGGWVIGIQADLDASGGRGNSVDLVNNAFFGAVGWRDESRIRSLGSVTGRIGYSWDRFLLYVRGGGAWERDRYSIIDPVGVVRASASETRGGWTVGGGGEYAFTNWLSGFVEYDYYDFGNRDNRFLTGAGALFDAIDVKERKSVLKAGLNLRWNWAGPVTARY
jgi:outer membrane immunogenic protein